MVKYKNSSTAAYYNYTAGGERNIKLTAPRLDMQQNAEMLDNPPLVYPTLYASPLVTLTQHGYTKHYFEEGRRICSKIGGGFNNVDFMEFDNYVEELASDYHTQYQQQKEGIGNTFNSCLWAEPQIVEDFDLHNIMYQEQPRDEEEPAFYYHSDHLGSSAYLTHSGQVIQVLNYLPYGEDWVEQNFFQPHDTTRLGIYRFNGKEKDYESGFHYYGARYYWSETLTGWLSVDPMVDKYPSLSPYNYCAWNPVKLIDPDGNEMWKPEVLADGSVNYIKEAGDNAKTLQDQYGLTESDAKKLYNTVKNGKISASDVKKVTGKNILKLDWNSSSDYQKIYHAMAALLHGVATGSGAEANMNNYFSNLPSHRHKYQYMGVVNYNIKIQDNIALPLLDGKEFYAKYVSLSLYKESPNIGNPQEPKQRVVPNGNTQSYEYIHQYDHPGGNLPLLHLKMDETNFEKYEKVYY